MKLQLNVFPNPFKDRLVFEFEVENQQNVSLRIFDASGKLIHLTNKNFLPGKQKIVWDGNTLDGVALLLELFLSIDCG